MVRKEIRSDQHVGKMRLRVPESYLENEVERVNGLTEKLRGVGKDQKAVDEIYDKVVRVYMYFICIMSHAGIKYMRLCLN